MNDRRQQDSTSFALKNAPAEPRPLNPVLLMLRTLYRQRLYSQSMFHSPDSPRPRPNGNLHGATRKPRKTIISTLALRSGPWVDCGLYKNRLNTSTDHGWCFSFYCLILVGEQNQVLAFCHPYRPVFSHLRSFRDDGWEYGNSSCSGSQPLWPRSVYFIRSCFLNTGLGLYSQLVITLQRDSLLHRELRAYPPPS